MAATAQAGPLVTIAAAGDGGRGVIAPCGRCRQVLMDQHPDVLVAVPGTGGPLMRTIWELLPDAYVHPDSDALRVLRFNKRYRDSVLSGEKTTTVRWNERISQGPVRFYFEDDDAQPAVYGEVLSIEPARLDELTAEQAGLPRGSNVADLQAGLRAHYPDMPDDANLSIVHFRLTGRY